MRFKNIVAHISIILSFVYIILFVFDHVNRAMFFIDNDITKVGLIVLCACSVVNAILVIKQLRAKARQAQNDK